MAKLLPLALLLPFAVTAAVTSSYGALTSGAWAVSSSPGNSYTKARVMPAGSTPTVSVSAPNVGLSWTGSTIGGQAVNGYIIRRYTTVGGVQTTGSGCSGTVATTSCTEASVPAGIWKYTIQPVRGNWTGPESSYSANVAVVAVPTAVVCSNCRTMGSTRYIGASIRSSVSVQVTLPATSLSTDTVTVKLTDTNNTTVTGTIAASAGAGTVTVTGLNTTSLIDGTITITAFSKAATGESSPTASASAVRDIIAPSGSDVRGLNKTGGTVNLPETGDQIRFVFSEQVDPATVLSGWDGTSTNVTVRLNNSATADILQIWNSANTAQLPLGSVGTNANITTANVTFAATMVQSGGTITITLGTCSDTTKLRSGANSTWAWTPLTGITDPAGNAFPTTVVNETGGPVSNL